MNHIKLLFLLGLVITSQFSLAAIHYVGQSAQCNGTNHHDDLAIALFAAALNGTESDEIRLTNTVTYAGSGDGTNVLSNWNASSLGRLTIIGGYSNCNASSSSGITVVGNGNDVVFRIKDQSEVTLKNLSITGGTFRGVVVEGESVVFMESVDISDNQAGVRVLDGSYLSVDENSVIFDNGSIAGIPKGGGLWCFGANSQVDVAGQIASNQATAGGNVFIEDGCFVQLEGGAEIKGDRQTSTYSADEGGGIFVDDGGELLATGGANRVLITDHWADFGAALYVTGTGRATLLNTFIGRNRAFERGSGLYAVDGGLSITQVVMDRAPTCPFLISCSEFDGNDFELGVVYVDDSKVQIRRTLFDSNNYIAPDDLFRGIITVFGNTKIEMSHSNFINNHAYFLVVNGGASVEMSHITAVRNTYDDPQIGSGNAFAWATAGVSAITRIQNSIWQDTQGGSITSSGSVFGKCNLVDDGTQWPVGSFVVGTAQFINAAGGDARQLASSPGVDMCQEDTFAWSTDRDIEYQEAPVNENTNPQGSPGEPGGLYDAGFDEVYDNIGEDEFLLTVQKLGSGSGLVLSDPLGIACGTDCTEVVFNGTLVKLMATPLSDSVFDGWMNCPLPNGNECFINVTQSATIRAVFQPDDLIFSNGFE